MGIENNKLFAVITGDIVNSSRIPRGERHVLVALLNASVAELNKHFPGSILYNISIFRGDSWQLVVQNLQHAFTIALYIRAYIKSRTEKYPKIDTRFAIGFGTIDFLPQENISQGTGQAFEYSGRGLESLGKNANMLISTGNIERDESINVILALMDAVITKWTAKQSLAVTGAIFGMKQEDIALFWGNDINRQAIGKHLHRANWDTIYLSMQFLANFTDKIQSIKAV